ncbi:oxidoreductase [Malaciobacter marinus]|uniref:SDR family oxidoreductase n=1 Tax=Malaciobacter marinus TaxID=505249 RepID=UPI000C08BC79|nr:SDR family oxidoreductase [Malaciobacter marinus]PHO11340.1 oxidoreductase [Malaciobacter marinus]
MKELIVITGASSGIGEATAKRFSDAGHPLLLIARRVEKIESLGLPNTICAKVDVTDFEAIKIAIKEAEEKYGKTGCLVNNAGAMLLGSVDTQDISEWQRMFDLNVLAVLNGMQAVLPDMKENRTGTIINISSIAGKKTFPAHAAYCGTKFAIHGISENVREEVASFNVRVVTIAPGAVETELLSHTSDDEIIKSYEEWKESMGGVIVPDDIARSIEFVYTQPQNVNIREFVIAATRQEP